MKTPLFMDKGVLAEDLSTKSIDSMDKEHFRRRLSMKRPDFMDKEGFRGGLSMKTRLSMDREEMRLSIIGGDGDGMKIFCRFAA